MEVGFVPPELRRLDKLRSEAICIPLCEDERPPRGALGLVDWRLSGAVSRRITEGTITGRRGERVLVPVRPRLPFEKLFLFGLGPASEVDDAAAVEATRVLLRTLSGARVRSATCVLPGRAGERIKPERAMEILLELASAGEQDEIVVVDDAESQKAMAAVVDRVRRRARAGV